jgi:hypothetical protein
MQRAGAAHLLKRSSMRQTVMWKYFLMGFCWRGLVMTPSELANVPAWLQARVSEQGSLIHEALAFGSITSGSPEPSDCDVIVVAAHSHETTEWRSLQSTIDAWKAIFLNEFGVPLSVILLTRREKLELALIFSKIWPPKTIALHCRSDASVGRLGVRSATGRCRSADPCSLGAGSSHSRGCDNHHGIPPRP